MNSGNRLSTAELTSFQNHLFYGYDEFERCQKPKIVNLGHTMNLVRLDTMVNLVCKIARDINPENDVIESVLKPQYEKLIAARKKLLNRPIFKQ
jgi:hypothetical protein